MLQVRLLRICFIMVLLNFRSPVVSPRPYSHTQQITITGGGFAIRTKVTFSNPKILPTPEAILLQHLRAGGDT